LLHHGCPRLALYALYKGNVSAWRDYERLRVSRLHLRYYTWQRNRLANFSIGNALFAALINGSGLRGLYSGHSFMGFTDIGRAQLTGGAACEKERRHHYQQGSKALERPPHTAIIR
jgi:hypothetical protein